MNKKAEEVLQEVDDHKKFFRALKVAVRFYSLYDCAYPDVGIGPSHESIVQEVLIEAKVSQDDLTDSEYKKLLKVAKRIID